MCVGTGLCLYVCMVESLGGLVWKGGLRYAWRETAVVFMERIACVWRER